ncbi:MAG: hypothetical protein EGP82_09495 [Odoribacter splanchnicus]|nr:hypothetical protein [Odoribacter splanchnicus]
MKYRNDKRAIFVIYRLDKGGRECRFQGIKILLPDLKNISGCWGEDVKRYAGIIVWRIDDARFAR